MKILLNKRLSMILLLVLFSSNLQAQTTEELKKQKLAEKEQKLKEAKQRAAQEAIAFSYHGGTMAPLGVAFYMINPDRIGFYASIRGGIQKNEPNKPFKGLNLNIGFTRNLFFPVAMYAAAGISDYEILRPKAYVSPYAPNEKYDSEWEFGFDTSFGLIFHVKGVELQCGVSLFNFSRPEFCFGIGLNALRN